MRLLKHVSTIFLAMVLLLSGPASAQNSNATLHGTITDQGGGVLPGVTVKLKSAATGLARDVVTNAAGGYVFNFLPPANTSSPPN